MSYRSPPANVATIAALKALTTTNLIGDVVVDGYASAGDGGGGLFRWNSADTSTDNGGTIIQPNAGGTGRWNRISPHAYVFDVRQYGAVGDGTTSDQTAVANAVAAASTAGGGIVFAPKGTYKLTAEIDIPSNVRLQGAGQRATIFKRDLTGLTGQVILGLIDANDAMICDVGVDGVITSTDDAPNRNGIAIGTSAGTGTRCRVERCTATNIDNGFSIGGAITRCGVYDSHVYGSHTVGARMGGTTLAITPIRCEVVGCSFTGGVRHGVYLTAGHQDCLLARNVIQTYGNNGIQAYLNAGQTSDALRAQIIDNRIDSVTWHGIYIINDNVAGKLSEGHIVRGNRITNATLNGIRIKDSKRNLVEGNWIDTCGVHGISAETSGTILPAGTLIVNNRVKAATTNGIYVESFDDGVVQGNVVDGSGGDNIKYAGATATNRGVCAGNVSINAGGWGLSVYGVFLIIGVQSFNNNTSGDYTIVGGTQRHAGEPLVGSATYDPANLNAGIGATTTVTVTGAALGDRAVATFSLDLQGITLTAWVSSPNTVSVRFQNGTAGALDLASGTLRAYAFQN